MFQLKKYLFSFLPILITIISIFYLINTNKQFFYVEGDDIWIIRDMMSGVMSDHHPFMYALFLKLLFFLFPQVSNHFQAIYFGLILFPILNLLFASIMIKNIFWRSLYILIVSNFVPFVYLLSVSWKDGVSFIMIIAYFLFLFLYFLRYRKVALLYIALLIAFLGIGFRYNAITLYMFLMPLWFYAILLHYNFFNSQGWSFLKKIIYSTVGGVVLSLLLYKGTSLINHNRFLAEANLGRAIFYEDTLYMSLYGNKIIIPKELFDEKSITDEELLEAIRKNDRGYQIWFWEIKGFLFNGREIPLNVMVKFYAQHLRLTIHRLFEKQRQFLFETYVFKNTSVKFIYFFIAQWIIFIITLWRLWTSRDMFRSQNILPVKEGVWTREFQLIILFFCSVAFFTSFYSLVLLAASTDYRYNVPSMFLTIVSLLLLINDYHQKTIEKKSI